ncbi:hypothetical protein [Neobacillus sp. NPDC093127]|uniref:hypothetical protein n=1 Tax=Neobacillus sp. NPDC093127 TaxID=3364296 RepID=UPI00382CCA57
MRIVVYDNDKKVVDIIEDINHPKVSGNIVDWEGGSVENNLPFLLLEDSVEVSEVVTDDIIALDKKSQFVKVDELAQLKIENADLKLRLEMAEMAIVSLMDFI